MSLPAYAEYKDSGVEWLGDVPKHWTTLPIRYLATERNSIFIDGDWIESPDISSSGIKYITTGNIGEGFYKEQGSGFISEEKFKELMCTEVFSGDLLISRLNPPIGRACIIPDLNCRVVTSVDNVILRPNSKFRKEYLVYLFSSPQYFKHTGDLSRGATMQRISRGLLGNIRIIMPSEQEQTTIARFLDHETAKIDALIAEQQRLIELLKEKRQAVISHAVTKGLDPNAPMKDSGVAWLGDVPEHWGVMAISKVTEKITNGYVGPTRDILVSEGVPYVQATHIKKGKVNFDGAYYVDLNWSNNHKKSILKSGDVLIVQTGAGTGDVGLVSNKEEGFNCHALIILTPSSGLMYGEYLSSVLQSSYGYAVLFSLRTGGMHPHLNCGEVREMFVTVPPCHEQIEINSYILRVTASYDLLVSEALASVSLLKERRSALISAAVTGKIDVRGWQPPATAATTPQGQQQILFDD